jgi:hypothetical protein
MLSKRGLQDALTDALTDILKEMKSPILGTEQFEEIVSQLRELSNSLINNGARITKDDLKNPIMQIALRAVITNFIQEKNPNISLTPTPVSKLIPSQKVALTNDLQAEIAIVVTLARELQKKIAEKRQDRAATKEEANDPGGYLKIFDSSGTLLDIVEGVSGPKQGTSTTNIEAEEGVTETERQELGLDTMTKKAEANDYQPENSHNNLEKVPRPYR